MEGKKGATGCRGLFCKLGRFACPSRAQEFMIGPWRIPFEFFYTPSDRKRLSDDRLE
jgi:hypothetical protein